MALIVNKSGTRHVREGYDTIKRMISDAECDRTCFIELTLVNFTDTSIKKVYLNFNKLIEITPN